MAKLVLFEPLLTFGEQGEREDIQSTQIIEELLGTNQRSDLVALYLSDKLPPGIITLMKRKPEWQYMVAIAHTLAYDNAVITHNPKLIDEAKAATMPVLLLDNSESPPLILEAIEALAQAMPHVQHKTLEDIWRNELDDNLAEKIDDSILIEFLNNSSARNNSRI